MGVKVTFLREDDGADAPAAQPVTLVPKAAVRTEAADSVRLRRRAATSVDRRAVKVGGADGDRVEVHGRPQRPASAWSCRRRRSWPTARQVVVRDRRSMMT